MRLSDFVLARLSNAKREYGSEGKAEAINKHKGVCKCRHSQGAQAGGPPCCAAASQTPLGSTGMGKLIPSW